MTTFGIIKPQERRAYLHDFPDLRAAQVEVNLASVGIDFGIAEPGVGIITFEFALLAEPAPDRKYYYFSIAKNLYGGPSVLYGFDEKGYTIDLPTMPHPIWFQDADAVEKAIERGEVIRPVTAINEQVIWQWPQQSWIPKQRSSSR